MGSYISTPVPKKDELAMRQAYSDAANFHEIFSYLCRHWQAMIAGTAMVAAPLMLGHVINQETDKYLEKKVIDQIKIHDAAVRMHYTLWRNWKTIHKGDPEAIGHLLLTAMHLQTDPVLDTRVLMQRCNRNTRTLRVSVIGGGPTGMTFAMLLAHELATSPDHLLRRPLEITIYDGRWVRDGTRGIVWKNERDANKNNRRQQVITLRDDVVARLDKGIDSTIPMSWSSVVWPANPLNGEDQFERVWPESRQAPIMEVEDRLLKTLNRDPLYRKVITLVPDNFDDKTLARVRRNCDLLVAASGGGPNSFIATLNDLSGSEDGDNGSKSPENPPWFPSTVLHPGDMDTALGLKIETKPSRTQAEIVLTTLSQTIFLLNSTSDGKGFLNIRLSSVYARALREHYTDKQERTLRNLEQSMDRTIVVIRDVILAGLRWYGLNREAVLDNPIDIFELPLRSINDPIHMCPRVQGARNGAEFPIIAVGDAAIQHNFWPGRGANSGLSMAWVLATNLTRGLRQIGDGNLDETHFSSYIGYVPMLKKREQPGRGQLIQRISAIELYNDSCESKDWYTISESIQILTNRYMELRKTTGGNNRFKAIHPIPVSDEAIQQAMDALENHESDTIQAICDLLARSKQWPVKEMNKAPNVDPERVIQMTSDAPATIYDLIPYDDDIQFWKIVPNPNGPEKKPWRHRHDGMMRHYLEWYGVLAPPKSESPGWLRDWFFGQTSPAEWSERDPAKFQARYAHLVPNSRKENFFALFNLDFPNTQTPHA